MSGGISTTVSIYKAASTKYFQSIPRKNICWQQYLRIVLISQRFVKDIDLSNILYIFKHFSNVCSIVYNLINVIKTLF